MAIRVATFAVALALLLAPAATAQLALVQKCLGERCENGRIHSVTVTPDDFVVIVDPDRCDRRMKCPTSYPKIEVDGDVKLRVDGYTPGEEKTSRSFSIWVPRRFKTLYFRQIDGSERSVAFDLRPFEADR